MEFEPYDKSMCSLESELKFIKCLCSKGTVKSHHELKPGRYNVNKFKLRHTKYGPRVIVRVDRTYYYIPSLFAAEMATKGCVDMLNNGRYIMIYHGINQNRAMVDFTREIE